MPNLGKLFDWKALFNTGPVPAPPFASSETTVEPLSEDEITVPLAGRVLLGL